MNEISLPIPVNCDHQRIESFLQSEHYRIEDDELIAHLDSCAACREYLEAHAADQETWDRAKTWLKTGEFDNAATAAFSAARSHTQSGHFPHAIQDVLDTLAPTDDPHRLGRIGTYEIAGVIGAGAMGVVLKAIDPSLDRVIALKVMAPRLANNETARKRFAREAKAAAAVLHPNVIPIHSVSSDKALPYLVMAYIRGGSLQKRLEKEGPLQLDEILRIGSQIAAGLAAAHEQGLVHRDIKPENILLEEGIERVTITDFGLARAVDDNTVTQMGVIAGTPMYMSPEQARGEQVDQLSDLFSLGSVLYALCTGQPPYRADSSYGVMRRIIDDSPTPIRKMNPAAPEWLACIVERLMAKEKLARFATASEVHKLLDACLSHVQQPNVLPLPSIPNLKSVSKYSSFLKTRKGYFLMFSTAAALLCAALFMLPERPSITTYGPAPSAAITPPDTKTDAATPSLTIESHKGEGSDGDGKTATHHWKLKGQSVGTLTVRVLQIEDGKARVVSETVYQGGAKGEQIIELEMQLKNPGDPLPFAGKALIPSLALSVNGLQSKAQPGERIILPANAGSHGHAESGSISNEQILMYEGYHVENAQHSKTIPSMLEASKKGAAFLVTTVDWKSTDQAVNHLAEDQKSIQGTWQVTYSEDSGRVATQEMLKNLKFNFKESAMTMHMGDKKSESTFKLDPTTMPKSIDVAERGITKQGIYDLQGDTLRICFAEKTTDRPTQFDSKPDSANDVIIVMKRVRDKTAEKPEIQPNGTNRTQGIQAQPEERNSKKALPADDHSQLEDPKQLEGKWRAIYGEQQGAVLPQNVVTFINLEISDRKYLLNKDGDEIELTMTLHPSMKPISFDLQGENGLQVRGILDLRGDLLRVCTNEGQDNRPKSFNTSAETRGTELLILKRVVPHNAFYFADDIETEFYRRGEITVANFPDGELSLEQAQEYATEKHSICLMSVKRFSRAAAAALAKTSGDLWLPDLDINDLPPGALEELLQKNQGKLYLDKCDKLNKELAQELSKSHCPISLSGLESVSSEVAQELAKLPLPLKLGITRLDLDTAKALSKHESWLILNKLKSITDQQAAVLAMHRGPLALHGIITMSPEIAAEFGKYNGEALNLERLVALDVESARNLSAAKCQDTLYLDGVKSITPEVIAALASGNYSLSLQGLVVRDIETRKALDAAAIKLREAGRTLLWGEVIEDE